MNEIRETVRRYLDHCAVEANLAVATVSAYRRDLDQYAGFLRAQGIDQVGAVTPAVVSAFLQTLSPKKKASSLARSLSAVRGLNRFCSDRHLTTEDPTTDMEGPKLYRRIPVVLSVEEVTRMLSVPFPRAPLGLRDKALMEFGYATGARVSEWARVRVADFAPDRRWVRLFGKGNKERLVPVGREARIALERYIREGRPFLQKPQSGDEVFLNHRGGAMSRRAIFTVVKKAAAEAIAAQPVLRINTSRLISSAVSVLMYSSSFDLGLLQPTIPTTPRIRPWIIASFSGRNEARYRPPSMYRMASTLKPATSGRL